MSRQHGLASLLITYHLLALGIASVPQPQSLADTQFRPSSDKQPGVLTALLDQAAGWLAAAEPSIFLALQPIRRVTAPYIAAGVGTQQWNMFANPFTEDNYVRIDYFVSTETDQQQRRHLRELVLPADREQNVRVARRFRDKAILNAFESFSKGVARVRDVAAAPSSTSDMEVERRLRSFEPITRYFRGRLTVNLPPDEHVIRTELWYGAAPIPPRGQMISEQAVKGRLEALEPYHDGPVQVPVTSQVGRSRGATEREADILWTLLYFDEP